MFFSSKFWLSILVIKSNQTISNHSYNYSKLTLYFWLKSSKIPILGGAKAKYVSRRSFFKALYIGKKTAIWFTTAYSLNHKIANICFRTGHERERAWLVSPWRDKSERLCPRSPRWDEREK